MNKVVTILSNIKIHSIPSIALKILPYSTLYLLEVNECLLDTELMSISEL